MSIRVMATVWQDAKEYREGPLLVLLALADWANDEGWCWPSVPAIAEKSRLTERQVYNVLAGLQCDGVIVRQGGGGRGKATRYRVIVSALGRQKNPETISGFSEPEKAGNPEADCRVSEGENPEAGAGNPEIGDTKTLKLDAAPYIEPSIEPSKAKTTTPLPPSQPPRRAAHAGDPGARGERRAESRESRKPCDDADGEIADAVIWALRVAGKRRQQRLREVLLTVIAQERAETDLHGEELQRLLVESWEDYLRVAPFLRWTFGTPETFFASPLWRQPEAWPRNVAERPMAREATVGMYRGEP